MATIKVNSIVGFLDNVHRGALIVGANAELEASSRQKLVEFVHVIKRHQAYWKTVAANRDEVIVRDHECESIDEMVGRDPFDWRHHRSWHVYVDEAGKAITASSVLASSLPGDPTIPPPPPPWPK